VNNPEISLSFRRLALAQCGATISATAVWWVGSIIGGFDSIIATAGAAEAGILLISSLIILALFSPQKKRPIATAATLWSVASFVRFIAALGGSTLLYYVAQFGLRPLLFSFLLTAVFLLVAETKTLASMLSEFGKQTNE
jgi:hypothetical protein